MSEIPEFEGSDLDAMIRRVDPDRWLSSRFIADAARRADVIALYAFDHELARAPKVASNPLLGEIRLTWWAETVEEIFAGSGPVRRHPTALAMAAAVARRALPREPLEAMVEARFRELETAPLTPDEALVWADRSAGSAAVLAATVLGQADAAEQARKAGQLWALALRQAGRASGAPDLSAALDRLIAPAAAEAHDLPVAAFPAVAHATLARSYARSGRPSELGKRVRLALAVARGRI